MMTEKALRDWMVERRLSIKEGSQSERIGAMAKVIRKVLPRKSVSDRTCHKRILEWIEGRMAYERRTGEDFLPRIIDAVLEANGPMVRNPNAVFLVILKSEFGYPD